MLAYLNGKIVQKSPTHIILDIGGIGYLIKITLNTYSAIENKESALFYTSLIVKSENQSVSGFDLYGFASFTSIYFTFVTSVS